jgi:hypothetical protein
MSEFTTPNPETETGEAFVDEVLVDEHGAPVFRADDLAILEAHNDAPIPLERAAKALIEMANDWPMYPSGNPIYGRFEFSNYAKSSLEIRAVFRIARAALDFLEKDFKASEAENFAWLENELTKFRAQGEAA